VSLLLHISDTHFGTEEPPVVKALQDLAHGLKPDVLVLSGDITQRARSAQFAAARAFVDSLDIRQVLTLPGNHDIPLYNMAARMFAPYAGYMSVFGQALEPELAWEDMLVIGVNTTRPARHKDGEVSRTQVERVSRRVRQLPRETLRVVVTHQPACVLRPEDEKDRLRGGDTAVKAWSQAGVDLVLGGHIHLPYVVDACALVPGTTRALYCIQAGTALSHRVRHGSPNSVNTIRWQPPAAGQPRYCEVQRWDFDLADGRFEPTQHHALVLGD
jgi:3',5'-cyclic AMP phosphodiesterase CpdA